MQQKMIKIYRICLIVGILHTILWGTSLHSSENDMFYMLPYEQDQAINTLKSVLKNAQSEIKISIYSFTNNDIAKILRDSAKRGVKISIIFDKESNLKNDTSVIGYLAKYNNISVCLLSGMRAKNKRYYGIMHQKMAIVDKKILVLGSANWSKNAFENNFETLLISHNQRFVQKALQGYEKMTRACVGF